MPQCACHGQWEAITFIRGAPTSQVYNQSGLLAMQQALAARGPEYSNAVAWLSYQLTPRASIFRRDAASVSDLAAMKKIMRSNSFSVDKVTDPVRDI